MQPASKGAARQTTAAAARAIAIAAHTVYCKILNSCPNKGLHPCKKRSLNLPLTLHRHIP